MVNMTDDSDKPTNAVDAHLNGVLPGGTAPTDAKADAAPAPSVDTARMESAIQSPPTGGSIQPASEQPVRIQAVAPVSAVPARQSDAATQVSALSARLDVMERRLRDEARQSTNDSRAVLTMPFGRPYGIADAGVGTIGPVVNPPPPVRNNEAIRNRLRPMEVGVTSVSAAIAVTRQTGKTHYDSLFQLSMPGGYAIPTAAGHTGESLTSTGAIWTYGTSAPTGKTTALVIHVAYSTTGHTLSMTKANFVVSATGGTATTAIDIAESCTPTVISGGSY